MLELMLRDNTVGSRGVLSEKQQAILLGLLLGDGHMEWKYRYPRLRINQTLRHKEYVDWLYDELKEFCIEKPHAVDVTDKRNGSIYYHYLFSTKISPVFIKYHKLFYQQGRKIVPRKLPVLLKNKISLAVWYMDDGFKRNDCSSLYLCTSGFSLEDQEFLQDMLYKTFGLETKMHFAGKNARIYFPVHSAKRFCELVRSFILPVFYYKLL